MSSKTPGVESAWPSFELIKLASDPEVSMPLATRLAETGVPRGCIGQEYQVLPRASALNDVDGRHLVAFAKSGSQGRICVDVEADTVVHIATANGLSVNPVNVNLDAFNKCISAVISRFPFYSEESESEHFEAVAEDIRGIVARIDPTALSRNGFWVTFSDDVAIGDYATEMIV